jgi:hypothetical protein
MKTRLEKLRDLQQQMLQLANAVESGKIDSKTATDRIELIRAQMDQLDVELPHTSNKVGSH